MITPFHRDSQCEAALLRATGIHFKGLRRLSGNPGGHVDAFRLIRPNTAEADLKLVLAVGGELMRDMEGGTTQ